MKTKVQFLLGKVGEECNEVAQRANKASDFGIYEVQQGQQLTNIQRLQQEFADLIAVMEMLEEEVGFTFTEWHQLEEMIQAKKLKVEKYYQLSKSLGQVE